MLPIFAFFCPLGIAKPSILTFVHVLPTLLIDACEDASAVEAPTKNREKLAGLGGENPRPSVSAPLRRGAAHRGLAIHHHIPSRNQRSRTVDLDDHAAKADMDAHGAMKPIREDGGRICDMPPVRLDCATGLTPQGRKRTLSIWPGGQNVIREVLMQAYGDLRQDCLLWLKANEIHAAEIAARFGSQAEGEEVRSWCSYN